MRLMFILATSSLAAGQAMAQETTDWSGAYGGLSAGVAGLNGAESSIDLVHGRWPNATYPTGILGNSAIESEFGSPSKTAIGGFFGMTFDQFGLLVGGEANLQVAPIERDYAIGPVRGPRTGAPRAVSFVMPATSNGIPAGATVTVLSEDDTITSHIKMDYNLSVRGRIGMPIADLVLVSAYAGVSLSTAQLDVTQHSSQAAAYFFTPTGGTEQSTPLTNTATITSTKQASLMGATFGALAEYKVNDEWTGRLDLSYTKFDEISSTNTRGTSVSINPNTWSSSLGFSRKF